MLYLDIPLKRLIADDISDPDRTISRLSYHIRGWSLPEPIYQLQGAPIEWLWARGERGILVMMGPTSSFATHMRLGFKSEHNRLLFKMTFL